MLITNGTIVTWEKPNRILEEHALYIEGDRISECAPQADLIARHPDAERVDAGGQFVMNWHKRMGDNGLKDEIPNCNLNKPILS